MKVHNTQTKQLVLFDLDGTLIDSVGDLSIAVNHMLYALDLKTYDITQMHQWVGNGARMLVWRALSGHIEVDRTLTEAYINHALEIFLAYYSTHLCERTTLYPGVHETLTQLQERGLTLAVITNKPFLFTPDILQILGLTQYFSLVLGGDSLAKKKPDPLPLLHACDTLGIPVKEAVMVGDSKNDILAAKSARMESIAVRYGYNDGEDIAIYEPSWIIDELPELIKILDH